MGDQGRIVVNVVIAVLWGLALICTLIAVVVHVRRQRRTWLAHLARLQARKPRAYIAGVVSLGATLSAEEIKQNVKAFYDAEDVVVGLGYEPVNPIALHRSQEPSTTMEAWQGYVRADIAALAKCQAIYLLAGWDHPLAKGSRLEYHIATELGMKILYEQDVLAELAADV